MSLLNNLKQTAIPAGLFFVLSLPALYKFTGANLAGAADAKDCPSPTTRLLHTLAFFVVSYLVAKYYNKQTDTKAMIKESLCAALLFFVLSSQEMYGLTDSVIGVVVKNQGDFPRYGESGASGCPSTAAVAVHTVVFALVLSWVKSLN